MYETIVTHLKSKEITLYRLSKDLDINLNTLISWKNRKNYLSFPQLCKIADYFGMSLDEFR